MRLPVAVLFAGLLVPCGNAQDTEQKHLSFASATGGSISLTADSIERLGDYPGTIRLKGHVEIRTPVCVARTCDGYMILRAEEAEFSESTGVISSQGSVRVTPVYHVPKNR